jgi:hypothetical protein
MLNRYIQAQSIQLGIRSLNTLIETMKRLENAKDRLQTIEKVKKVKTIKNKLENYGKYH